MDSTSSPNSSIRTGSLLPGGQASTRPPRCANSPTPVTSTLGSYPPATSRSSRSRWATRSPTWMWSRAPASCSGASVRCTRASRGATTTIPPRPVPSSARTVRRSADSSCSGSARSSGRAARSGRIRTCEATDPRGEVVRQRGAPRRRSVRPPRPGAVLRRPRDAPRGAPRARRRARAARPIPADGAEGRRRSQRRGDHRRVTGTWTAHGSGV